MLSLTHRETLEKFLPKKFEAERVSLRSNSYSTPHKFRREFEFALRALCPHRSSSTLARLRARREVRRLGKITCPFQGRVFFIFFLFFFRNFSLLLFLFFFLLVPLPELFVVGFAAVDKLKFPTKFVGSAVQLRCDA